MDKQVIYHHAIFALRFLSVCYVSVCLSSLNRAKGLDGVRRMSRGGSLSSKSITVTERIYPPGILICLSPLCLQWPRAVCVYLLLLGGEPLQGIEKCQGGQLFLTAGSWPWSFFSRPPLFFFIFFYWTVPCALLHLSESYHVLAWHQCIAPSFTSMPGPLPHQHADKSQGVMLLHLFHFPHENGWIGAQKKKKKRKVQHYSKGIIDLYRGYF